MRRESNDMQFMNNMDTWLNQANYDKYEYLLEEDKEDHQNEDYM